MNRPLLKSLYSIMYSNYSSSTSNVLKTGSILKQSRVFSDSDVSAYSNLTHDLNPLHFDVGCAKRAGFTDILVPGMLVASLFPRIIASSFPGAVYVKQNLDFRSPVYIGDEIVGEVEASNIRQMKDKYMVKFLTRCFKNGESVVIGGEAMAILPSLDMKQL